jgi:hypothetical protein
MMDSQKYPKAGSSRLLFFIEAATIHMPFQHSQPETIIPYHVQCFQKDLLQWQKETRSQVGSPYNIPADLLLLLLPVTLQ